MTDSMADQIAQIRPQKALAKTRISPRVRKAIAYMVWDAMDRTAAAERAGITSDNLRKALKQPKVKALMAQEFKELREGAPIEAYANIRELGHTAKSEDVRLRSNQWVAGVDGLAPVTKVQGQMKVSHAFEGFAYPGATIEGTASTVPIAEDDGA